MSKYMRIMSKKVVLNEKRVPEYLYKKITQVMPVFCVDVIFKSKNKVYLFKRSYQPAKNKWWIVGGRVLKGERLRDAAIRKAKEEIGVDVKIQKMVGTYELFLQPGYFNSKKGAHTISVCFLAQPKDKNFTLNLNEEYTGYRLISRISRNLHPYIQKVLKDSGVF